MLQKEEHQHIIILAEGSLKSQVLLKDEAQQKGVAIISCAYISFE